MKIKIKKSILKNGLILLTDKDNSNIINISLYVKAGQRHGNKQLAHFVEHMVFTGTKKREQSEIIGEIEGLGGKINASTNLYSTRYSITVPKHGIDTAIDILSNMVQNSEFKKEMVDKERNILVNELLENKDEIVDDMCELIEKTMFEEHPSLGKDDPEFVRNVSREELLDFYRSYYVPNNMLLTISGNFKGIINKVKKAFNQKPSKIPLIKDLTLKAQQNNIELRIRKKTNICTIAMAYKTVDRLNEDSNALRLISAYLGKGATSKLFTELRLKRSLLYSFDVDNETETNYGIFTFIASADKKDIPEIKRLFLNEINELKNMTVECLNKAKNKLIGSYLTYSEDKKTRFIEATFEELYNAKGYFTNAVEDISSVTLKDVKRVAERYFNHYTCIVLEQKG